MNWKRKQLLFTRCEAVLMFSICRLEGEIFLSIFIISQIWVGMGSDPSVVGNHYIFLSVFFYIYIYSVCIYHPPIPTYMYVYTQPYTSTVWLFKFPFLLYF